MRIIYNRLFPFGSYWAINLCGIILARGDKGRLGPQEMRHEYIHTLQQREMLFVAFYVFYLAEWFVRLVQYGNLLSAYRNISFEREAYDRQAQLRYPATRKPFAWIHYLRRP